MAARIEPLDLKVLSTAQPIPRSQGKGVLSSKLLEGRSVIDDFRCSGALRVLFPRAAKDLPAILINTSGGLTSGDQFSFDAIAGAGSTLTLSTQAAERAYRAINGPAQTQTILTVEAGATLNWLPQELILFDGCDINRRLKADLSPTSRFLFVEPLIFGRTAMGETVTQGRFLDRVSVYRDGTPLYLDRVKLDGNMTKILARRAIGKSTRAMAGLLYVAPNAEAHLQTIRAFLPDTGGASLIAEDTLALRVLASDGFELRRSLLPILDLLSQDTLPKTWRL